jgi:acetyl esterase
VTVTAISLDGEGDLIQRCRTQLSGELHADARRLAEKFAAHRIPRYDQLSVMEARLSLEAVTRLQSEARQLASVGDILVPGAEGLLPTRIYRPSLDASLALVIYLHGGGWTLGSVAAADGPCRRLSAAAGCIVASVEYRRAPETKFPGPLADCLAAVRELIARAEELGADPKRITLMGDSAGGNLAAAVSLALRDEGAVLPASQILLYPCLSPARGTQFPSYRDHAEGPFMTSHEMEWFWDHYLREDADGQKPFAAPLQASDFTDLPATTLMVAEIDVLRDEGLRYAEQLRVAGVPVDVFVFPSAPHGFWWMDAALGQANELDRLLARQLHTLA